MKTCYGKRVLKLLEARRNWGLGNGEKCKLPPVLYVYDMLCQSVMTVTLMAGPTLSTGSDSTYASPSALLRCLKLF